MNVSHSTVIECLKRLGIHDKGARKRVITQGQIPFGYDYKKGKSASSINNHWSYIFINTSTASQKL